MLTLKGKTAVITGGTSGMGYSTAKLFKALGAKVIVTGRNVQALDSTASELGVSAIRADQANLADIDQLVNKVKQEFGELDILFLNAGIASFAPFEITAEEMFDNLMNINVKGTFFTLQKFLPILKDGASVITLASMNAHTGMENTAAYGVSKAALTSLVRTTSTELAPRNIRVNAVNPGPVQTEIFGKLGMPEDALNEFASAMLNRVPLNKLGKPEDVANLVAFLASDASGFITGSEYNIDGGLGVNPVFA
jgi:NAD(P)-dependent dehydrogenase (short-subunit alcohol dehydrogenase family)